MNNKKGISLIVLVITILVMIILAGVVVVTMQDNNPIQKAQTANKLTSIAEVRQQVATYLANQIAEGGDMSTLMDSATTVTAGDKAYKKLIETTNDAKLGVSTKSPVAGGFYAVNENGGCIFVCPAAKQAELGYNALPATTLTAEGVYIQ